MAAMLSPTFKVRDYVVQDILLYPISISWKPTSEEMTDGDNSSLVFERSSIFPVKKYVSFYRNEDFELLAYYSDISVLPPGTQPMIGKFRITNIPKTADAKKIKVKIAIDIHGLFCIESAQLIEEVEEMEVDTPKPTPAKDAATPTKDTTTPKEAPPTPEVKVDAPPEQKPEQKMETETSPSSTPAPAGTNDKPPEKEKEKKIKVKKVDLPIISNFTNSMTSDQIKVAYEHEVQMALQDRIAAETAEKKNAVESYAYDLKNKVNGEWAEFATDKEKENAVKLATAVEDWLYNEGEVATKSAYSNKLEELMKLGEPIKARLIEDRDRSAAVQALRSTISELQQFVESTDPKYEHIEKADRDKIAEEIKSAHTWLEENLKKQSATPKNANPVILVKDLKHRRDKLENFARPIMNRPKPKPKPEPKPEEKKPEPAPAQPQPPPTTEQPPQPTPAPTPEQQANAQKKNSEPEIMQTD